MGSQSLNVDIEDLISVANALADAAAPETLRHFRSNSLSISNKDQAGFDPVTVADRAAEKAIRSLLADLRPNDGILGEEFGSVESRSGFTWIIDPIDGTRGYMSGTPTWGTLIALRDQNGPVLGLIDQPYIGERFIGAGGRAWIAGPHGEAELQTRQDTTLEAAVLFTTFPEVGTEPERRAFEAVSSNVRLTRFGMDCYAYALLAMGQVDLVIEAGLNAYDIQAPLALIEAAGGVVTDWSGQPLTGGGAVIAAGNRHIHGQALEIVRESLKQS
jgi:histidinol phosphatase-like enzyme (inositol monophosphatase family)